MQVVVTLQVSAKEFYDLMIVSLQEELEKVNHRKYKEEELSGLRYKKKSHAQHEYVKIHVGKLIKNKQYVNTFSVSELSTKVTYQLEETGPLSCRVTYTEEYSKQPHFSILNPPSRRARKMIKACEKYIIEQRKSDPKN